MQRGAPWHTPTQPRIPCQEQRVSCCEEPSLLEGIPALTDHSYLRSLTTLDTDNILAQLNFIVLMTFMHIVSEFG